MAGFDRVVVTCPVWRLGSLMDFSPLINGLAKHFGGRLVLNPLSPQASSLWRYKLREIEKKYLEGSRRRVGEGRVIGIPLADDGRNSIESYNRLADHTPPQSYRIGIDRVKDPIEKYFDEDDEHFPPHLISRGEYFDCLIQTRSQTFPQPIILNAYLKVLKAAIEEDGTAVSLASLPEAEKRPLVWTGPEEREIAEEYFHQTRLLPGRTIGLHLTAGSYDVYKSIWPKESFSSVARHFIEMEYNILAITGSFGKQPGADENAALHRAFIDALQTSYGSSVYRHAFHLFQGETLAQAEVIRKCTGFLSAETGPAHLASAVGTPKVTIAASQTQADLWMLTGANDFGFVSERDKAGVIIEPQVSAVIAAMEVMLQPKRKVL